MSSTSKSSARVGASIGVGACAIAAGLWVTLVFNSMVVSRQCIEWSILLMFFILSIVLCAIDTGVACKTAYADEDMDAYEAIGSAATVSSSASSTPSSAPAPRAGTIALVCFRLCSAFVVLALVVVFALFETVKSPSLMPLQSQYLEHDVTVSIEEGGELVHVRAKTLNDLFFAQGMVTAERRLWQLEFQRLVGQGNLSIAVGEQVCIGAMVERERDKLRTRSRFCTHRPPHAAQGLATDVAMRTLGVYEAAKRAYHDLDAKTRSAVDSYTAGINAYLRSEPSYPLEFFVLPHNVSEWKPADSMVWSKIMSLDLSGNLEQEITRLALLAGPGAGAGERERRGRRRDQRLSVPSLRRKP